MKNIYTFISMALVASGAFAFKTAPFNGESVRTANPDQAFPAMAKMQRVTSSNLPNNFWGYNCDISSWGGFGKQTVTGFQMATEYDSSLVKMLAGKKISKLAVVSPAMKSGSIKMTMFLTYDLDGERAVEVPFTSTGCPMTDQGISALKYDIVDLPEPIVIEADKPFFIGVSADEVKAEIYPMVYDGMSYDGKGILYTFNGINGWQNASSSNGSLCMYLGLDENPENIARIVGHSVGLQENPGKTNSLEVQVMNLCQKPLSSLEAQFVVGSQAVQTFTASSSDKTLYYAANEQWTPGSIPARSFGLALCNGLEITQTGRMAINASATKVNGNENPWVIPYTSSLIVVPEGQGYKRNVVVEEGTGTWCPWCVRGIVGMEYMTEKYTDGSYIGIAVHANDRMQATSYAPMIQSYYSNFPTAIVNRDASIDPNSQEMEQAYQYYSAIRGAGQVELDIEKINGTTDADVKATAEFAVPGKYAIAYVVKENGVGPYQQQNAYAGGRYGAMGGFEKKGNPCSVVFNDVAINIFDAFGIEGSLPENVETGKQYTDSYSVSLKGVKDIANTSIVAMIIDQETGLIINATEKKLKTVGISGVEAEDARQIEVEDGMISVNGNEGAEVYTIDGRRVASISAGNGASVDAGIYIVRVGGKSVKVFVK